MKREYGAVTWWGGMVWRGGDGSKRREYAYAQVKSVPPAHLLASQRLVIAFENDYDLHGYKECSEGLESRVDPFHVSVVVVDHALGVVGWEGSQSTRVADRASRQIKYERWWTKQVEVVWSR